MQEFLEKRQYIPNMAGILLAQNDSKIIGVVINDHEKYEGHTLDLTEECSSFYYYYNCFIVDWRNNKMEKRGSSALWVDKTFSKNSPIPSVLATFVVLD